MSRLRDEYEFKVAGFAKRSCKKCGGTGKLGYEGMESGRVQPCPCVVFFLHSDIQRLADEHRAKASKEYSELK